jgi:hypothetical protein
MYSVVINGVTIQCQDPAEAVRLAKEVATLNGAAQQTGPSISAALAAELLSPPAAPAIANNRPADVADEVQSNKWTEPAKRVIALLAGAGSDGVDLNQIVKVAGLKGSKGSGPVLKEIIKLLGVDDGAVDRPRAAAGGRKIWVLKPRGVRAAAKLGLMPQTEASNGK